MPPKTPFTTFMGLFYLIPLLLRLWIYAIYTGTELIFRFGTGFNFTPTPRPRPTPVGGGGLGALAISFTPPKEEPPKEEPIFP